MKAFVIIKTGSTFSTIKQEFGDFEDWMIAGCGVPVAEVSVINVIEGESLPSVESISGMIITGSPSMVTDQEAWMRALACWIVRAVERDIPVLGVCFGHQLLAQAMGGAVDYHPQGREIGTVSIELTAEGMRDPLLGYLPDTFKAHVTHAQTVTRLPENALRLAGNPYESHHAFRIGSCAWGVQFHPEFTEDIMQAYVSEHAGALCQQGHDVYALKTAIDHTELVNALLKRFYVYCVGPKEGG